MWEELALHGPGSGMARAVAAVKADLFFCAMEVPPCKIRHTYAVCTRTGRSVYILYTPPPPR